MTTINARLARLEAGATGNDLRAVVERAARVKGIDPVALLAEAERIAGEIRVSGMTPDDYAAAEWGCDLATARDRIDATTKRWKEATR